MDLQKNRMDGSCIFRLFVTVESDCLLCTPPVCIFFPAHSDLYQVTTVELFKVTMYAAQSSNGSHFLTAWFLMFNIRSVNLGIIGQNERLLCNLSTLQI